MTIIIFLVDTSASMNQRTYLGTTLLDVAKGAIENFMKFRARDPNARLDRYMLLTFDDPPGNVKAGWKENHATFINELKHLEAIGLTNLGTALKNTFDLLNVNRMQSGIDTYGQGRCPFYLEPAVIITITDGRAMTSNSGVSAELNLPMNHIVPGSELTKEPFRWDQRLFGLVLRLPAVPPAENLSTFIPSAEDAAVDAMCEVTGGRSYNITTHRMLMSCLESLVQKCQSGVVINFEKIGPDPPNAEDDKEDCSRTPTLQSVAWHNCRRMIFVPRSVQKGVPVGFWPIPEAFWPDLASTNLPPRNAQPNVKFTCSPSDPMSLEGLPFDKYELEPSPLTQYILERRQPNCAWQVFIGNSAKYSDIGQPFGYIKASTNLQAVNLFVMPYNYPTLIPLLDEVIKVHKYKPTAQWRQKFDNYLKTMPVYYAQPLKRALARMNMHYFVPDNMENCLSYSVVSYLKKLKNQAKVEYEKMVASVGIKTNSDTIAVNASTKTSVLERKDLGEILERCHGDLALLRKEVTEYSTFSIHVPGIAMPRQPFKNPFDIQRSRMISQVRRMRKNFFKTTLRIKLQDEDAVHNQPVQQMGNYQDYLKALPAPLREVEATPSRMHTFGNPFKVNKNLMIDEADEAMPGQQASSKKRAHEQATAGGHVMHRPNKRKAGPLPRDVPASRLMSPIREEPASPGLDRLFNQTDKRPSELPLNSHSNPSPVPTNHFNDAMEIDDDDVIMLKDGPISASDTNSNRHMLNSDMIGRRRSSGDSPTSDYRNHVDMLLGDGDQHGGQQNGGQNNVREFNRALKARVVKEVKRPGKNYELLFQNLQTMRGCLDTRCLFLRDIRREALRFKKRQLAELLTQFEDSMVKAEPTVGCTATNGGQNMADGGGSNPLVNSVNHVSAVSANHRSGLGNT